MLTPDSEGKLSIDANAKALIEKKLQEKGFFINLNVATLVKNRERSEFFLENIIEAFFGTIAIAIKWKRGQDGQKD